MRFVLLVMVMLVAGCGSAPPPCGPSTCSGCCSAEGECLGGVTAQRCGARGNQCVSCPENESCNVGVCLAAFTPRPEEPFDAGATMEDSGVPDAGEADAGELDAGAHDSGVPDAGATDAGATDAGLPHDAGSQPFVDAGVVVDAGTSDCAGTLAPCSGTCRDLRADLENCGSCGRVCGSGQVCNQGTCAPLPMDCTLATCGAGYSCDPLTRRCVTGCRLSTDCPMGATCQQGQCQCPSMNHACGQTCVSNQAVTSCGARCTTCPQPAANGVASCTAGACAFACNPGFVASGGTCVDVNECLVDNGGCGNSITTSCTNTPGGRTCGCVTGYGSADGGVCTDVDECATNNGGCSSNATCTNTIGQRTCACLPGWVGDGLVCTRVTCATNNGGCDPNAICTNTATWPTCACAAGFEGSGQWCLAASSQKSWRSRHSTPPQLFGSAMAYDPVRRRTVLFGGLGNTRVNETWEFDGTTWTQRTLPGTLPPARTGASMAFDPLRGVLVMAGGTDGQLVSTASRYDMGFMSDVWEYNGSAWVSVGYLPERRSYATLVFDTARNKLVLAGGNTREWDASRSLVTERIEDEVYERTGTAWARNPARIPLFQGSRRSGVSFAYDPVRAVLVMIGGSEETWTFNGTMWAEVTTARLTPAPNAPRMEWDVARQRVVVTIGHQSGRAFSETREFDGTSWVSLPSSTPSVYVETMAYDSGRNRVVLLGRPVSGGSSGVQSWELGVFPPMPSNQYAQSTITASCTTLSNPTTLLGAGVSPAFGDETTSATVPLPFGFWLFGTPVTHFSVQTNGLVQLHANASGLGTSLTYADISTPLPSTSGPNGFIAGLWTDLEPLPTGRVVAQTFGLNGHRIHVVEWRDVVRFNTMTTVGFQVKLFEETGTIEVHWCNVPTWSPAPVVALENLTGTAAVRFTGVPSTGSGVRFTP